MFMGLILINSANTSEARGKDSMRDTENEEKKNLLCPHVGSKIRGCIVQSGQVTSWEVVFPREKSGKN